MSDERTKTHTATIVDSSIDGADDLVWNLSVAHHDDPRFLGNRLPIQTETSVSLGRDEACFGENALSDSRVSRVHARVWVTGGGVIKIEDKESRNGTFVNGETVEKGDLVAGDVIRLGSILLLVHRAPVSYKVPNHKTLIGKSYGISCVLEDVEKVAPHRTTVLLHGETGTGKEVVSRAIHDASGRKGAFKAINCGGMTDTLLQSELFGHVRGAFSGADREREGLIEASDGGTLFLDEIGDASPALQVSLLRFLQEGEVRRIGSNRSVKVDTRIIAATHRVTRDMITDGSFREDLFARLSRWEIHIPPLSARLEDIPHLAAHFLRQASDTPQALHHSLALMFLRYSWPRNVRELEMAIERAVIESEGEALVMASPAVSRLLEQAVDEMDVIREQTPNEPVRADSKKKRSKEGLEALLKKHGGNVRLVSQELGVARNTLYRWFANFDLDPESYRK